MLQAQSIDWWLERLEGVTQASDGYHALCPAHRDTKPSLHLTVDDRGVVAHCFAGCSYGDIVLAIQDAPKFIGSNGAGSPVSTPASTKADPRRWWSEYTGIAAVDWETWGVQFTKVSVDFTWQTTNVKKKRLNGTKTFQWYPEHSAAPPLWPDVPTKMPDTIYIVEGESDTGVLRRIGRPAWSLTKGAGTKNFGPVWKILYSRGVRTVILVVDADEAGARGLLGLRTQAETAKLAVGTVHVEKLIDPLLGEKDLRNVWLRVRDADEMAFLIDSETEMFPSRQGSRMDLDEFIRQPIEERPWLIRRMVLARTIHMIVGAPKMMKSWLGLDMLLSIGTGTPFLGQFEVAERGAVVYISIEDPDYLLHDRFSKMLIARGLAPRLEATEKSNRLHLVVTGRSTPPVYLDLSRNFVFDAEHTDNLIAWLHEIKAKVGRVSAVIFDPILRMLPPNIDEFKASSVSSSIFANAERIRTELDTAVILVHHRSKAVAEGKNSYGSVAFHAFAEGTCFILGDEPDSEGWIQVKNEFKSAAEARWAYRYADLETSYQVEASIGSQSAVVKNDRLDVIRDLVYSHLAKLYPEGAVVADLVREFNGPTDLQLRTVLIDMENAGEVKREKEAMVIGRKGGPKRDVWIIIPESES